MVLSGAEQPTPTTFSHSRVATCKRPVGDAPLPMLSTEVCPGLVWEKNELVQPQTMLVPLLFNSRDD